MLEIWRDLLHVNVIGVNDSFFELGGHSLLAVRMLSRVKEMFGKTVPVATLMSEPTISAIIAFLRSDTSEATGPYMVLNADGTKPPLIFFHGDINGGGFHCRMVARLLGDDQPLYAIDPHGTDRRPLPPTIEAMADEYTELARSIAPHGPYRLAGYCNGGLIAFEVARHLAQSGEKVDRLILVAAAPNGALRAFEPMLDRIARFAKLSDQGKRAVRRAYLRCCIFAQELTLAAPADRRRILREFSMSSSGALELNGYRSPERRVRMHRNPRWVTC